MSVTMAIRLVILTDPEVRAALRMASGEQERDMSAIADEILRQGLHEYILRVRKKKKHQHGEEEHE